MSRTKINQLDHKVNYATIKGCMKSKRIKTFIKDDEERKLLLMKIQDESGEISVVCYHDNPSFQSWSETLTVGEWFSMDGRVKASNINNEMEMILTKKSKIQKCKALAELDLFPLKTIEQILKEDASSNTQSLQAVVQRCDTNVTVLEKSGKRKRTMVLVDKSGEIEANLWETDLSFKRGQVIRITKAKLNLHPATKTKQLEINTDELDVVKEFNDEELKEWWNNTGKFSEIRSFSAGRNNIVKVKDLTSMLSEKTYIDIVLIINEIDTAPIQNQYGSRLGCTMYDNTGSVKVTLFDEYKIKTFLETAKCGDVVILIGAEVQAYMGTSLAVKWNTTVEINHEYPVSINLKEWSDTNEVPGTISYEQPCKTLDNFSIGDRITAIVKIVIEDTSHFVKDETNKLPIVFPTEATVNNNDIILMKQAEYKEDGKVYMYFENFSHWDNYNPEFVKAKLEILRKS